MNRVFLGCFLFLINAVVSGIGFGFTALKPVLVEYRIFQSACDDVSNGCSSQLVLIDWMFVLFTSSMNILDFISGPIVTKIGGKRAIVWGCTVTGVSALIFGLAIKYTINWLTFVMFSIMSLAGSNFVYIAMFELSSLQLMNQDIYNGFVIGTWEISALVLLFAQYLDGSQVIQITTSFFILSILCLSFALGASFLIPVQDPPTEDELQPITVTEQSLVKRILVEFTRLPIDYGILIVWTSMFALHHYVYMSTVYEHLLSIDSSASSSEYAQEYAQEYAEYFALIYPVMGFIWGPLAGLLLKHVTFLKGSIILTVLELAFGILSICRSLRLQIVTFIVFVACRSLMWLLFYQFLQKRAGKLFTSMLGIVCGVAGLTTLTGFGFIYVAEVTLNGRFYPVDIFLTILALAASLVMTIKAWWDEEPTVEPLTALKNVF